MKSADGATGGTSSETEPLPVEDGGWRARAGDGTPEVARVVTELTRKTREFERLRQVIERINRGVRLDDVLGFIYDEFRDVMPYNRISYAAVDCEADVVTAKWSRSEERQQISAGYALPLAQTSLLELCRTGRPRIIADLAAYLRGRPESESTRRLLAEGMRSSLTCPLIVEGKPVGFLFFDSCNPQAYSEAHVEFFTQIAGVVAVLIERGRMFSELAEQKTVIEKQSRLLERENQRTQQELELARKVQRTMIPASLPDCPGLQMAMLYEPAARVGGDVVDCIRLSHDSVLVYIADAMGHGVPAALLMSAVRTAFHAALIRQRPDSRPSPAALLAEVNRTVAELFGANYATAVCARVDRGEASITLSLAGHPPALLCRRGEAEVVEVAAQSVPLGINAGTTFIDRAASFDTGDLLLLYTDGVTEAASHDETFFGLAGLKRILCAADGDSVVALLDRIRGHLNRHTGRAALEDDLTMLAVQAS